MPYLASRYFGTRVVSRVFSCFLFAWFLGAAVGPVAFARLSADLGSASTPLLLLAALQLVPAALFLSLNRPGQQPERTRPDVVRAAVPSAGVTRPDQA